jgi:glycosyltransferase involved in cell wall biosynthesis
MNLVQGLRSRGIDVILVCRKDFSLEDIAKKSSIPYYALRMKSNFTGIDNLIDLLRLRGIVKKHKIDLIHCHRGKDHWLSACVRFLFPGSRKPVLIRTRHVTIPVKKHIFNRWLYKKGTDGVIAVSGKAASSLEGLPLSSPPAVIYAAVDKDRFCPEKRSEQMRRQCGIPESDPKAPLIGIVGRLQRIKGQHIFIRAMTGILQVIPNARFVIAGRGSSRKSNPLIRMAHEQGVFDRIYMPGYMDNIEELIASLDVGVIASLGSEGSSRICMEYMASGVPIVASSVGGIPELLENGLLGSLVESGNPDLLVRTVIEILSNKTAARQKVEIARKKAIEFLNLNRFIDETLGIYQKLSTTTS